MITDYLRNKLIKHVFLGEVYTPPSGIYMSLVDTIDTADPYNPVITEFSYSGYERKLLPSGTYSFQGGIPGTVALPNAVVSFATTTSSISIEAYAFYDESVGGNLLQYRRVSISVPSGQTPIVAAYDITFDIQSYV